MGIKNDINFTYNGYLQNLHYANDVTDKEQIQQMLLPFKQAASSLNIVLLSAPILFAIDYTKQQYLFFSNSLGHHKAEQVIEGGLEFTIPLMPKEFFKTYNQDVFPAMLSFFKNIPQAQQTDYLTAFNYKIKNNPKEDTDIYQRCSYITSKETGLPTHCVGIAYDISHVKKMDVISVAFKKINKTTGKKIILEEKCFYPYQEEGFFTPQEKIVLQYLVDGLISKIIADKLKICLKTVESHRYNMLRKASAKNVSELIAFAFKNKIL